MTLLHQCTEACSCPDHGTPLLYSAAIDDHACGVHGCRFYRGFRPVWEGETDPGRQYLMEEGRAFWEVLLEHERGLLTGRPLPRISQDPEADSRSTISSARATGSPSGPGSSSRPDDRRT